MIRRGRCRERHRREGRRWLRRSASAMVVWHCSLGGGRLSSSGGTSSSGTPRASGEPKRRRRGAPATEKLNDKNQEESLAPTSLPAQTNGPHVIPQTLVGPHLVLSQNPFRSNYCGTFHSSPHNRHERWQWHPPGIGLSRVYTKREKNAKQMNFTFIDAWHSDKEISLAVCFGLTTTATRFTKSSNVETLFRQ